MKTLNLYLVLFFMVFWSPLTWTDGDSSGDERPVSRTDLPLHLMGGGDATEATPPPPPVPESGDAALNLRTEREVPRETAIDPALEAARAAEREEVPPTRGLRTATDGEEEAVVTPTTVVPTVQNGETVELRATDLTAEEAAARQREEQLRRDQERAAAEAAEAARRAELERQGEQERGETCSRDKGNLINHQRQIFGLESPQGNKLLELLKRQDDLKARITTFDTLLDIWKQYQGFLDSNKQLVEGSIQTPNSAQEAINKLDELDNFIGNNQQPVERYQVAAEILSALPDRQALRQIDGDEAKFNYIKNALKTRCAGDNATHLYVCGVNLDEAITFEPQINRNPTNRGELINKFVNTAVNIDGADYVFNLNFSSLFVDDERHTNLTGQADFADSMRRIIHKAKDYCRHQILLEESESVRCLQAPLNEVLGSDLGSAQTNVINRLQAIIPGGGEINNIGDLTTSYLQMAKRTNDFHEEMAGGSINKLGDIAKNVETLSEKFQNAEAALTDPTTVRLLRTQFKNLTSEKILNLGRSLNHGEFQRNQEVFKNYLDGHPNLLSGPGRLNLEKGSGENKAQFANRLVSEILCRDSSGSCPVSSGIFTQNGEDLVLDQNNIIEMFNNLMEAAGGPNAIKDILGEEQEQGLKDELARVQNEIAAIKNGDNYKSLNAFKDFIWEQVKESCMQGSDENRPIEHIGSSCVLANQMRTGLNDFLQIGNNLLSFRNREEARTSVTQLQAACVNLHEQDNVRYQRDYVQTGICPAVFEEKLRIDQANIARAENARRGPTTHDPNIIYRYDSEGRVISRHVPNSNLAIFLPQAAYTFNEQLPFYFVQRPGMNMAIENWRQMGFQQKTAQAYWDAQRQSYLNNSVCGPFGCYYNSTMLEGVSPTFGQFGFGFGSTTTIPTTFNAGVNTIPSNNTGFGF